MQVACSRRLVHECAEYTLVNIDAMTSNMCYLIVFPHRVAGRTPKVIYFRRT